MQAMGLPPDSTRRVWGVESALRNGVFHASSADKGVTAISDCSPPLWTGEL